MKFPTELTELSGGTDMEVSQNLENLSHVVWGLYRNSYPQPGIFDKGIPVPQVQAKLASKSQRTVGYGYFPGKFSGCRVRSYPTGHNPACIHHTTSRSQYRIHHSYGHFFFLLFLFDLVSYSYIAAYSSSGHLSCRNTGRQEENEKKIKCGCFKFRNI